MKSGENLAVPLTQPQIEAASRLYYDHCEFWKTTDAALDSLARAYPDLDLASSLLKVAALDSLYYTQVWSRAKMARHIQRVLQETEASSCSLSLVEKLANVPGLGRNFRSFASKFAHFFC